jgi:hypothetical protein
MFYNAKCRDAKLAILERVLVAYALTDPPTGYCQVCHPRAHIARVLD